MSNNNDNKPTNRKKQVIKKRNWATICYPESVPKNWIEIIKQSGAQVAISPLHDKDHDENEENKKPHWHILIVYPGPKSFESVQIFCQSFGGVCPQSIESVKGYYRYFTHKDNPEKFQYSDSEIICLNGFNILDYADISKSEGVVIKKHLQELIIKNNFYEYAQFMDYLLYNGTDAEYDIASSNTIFFNAYIKSHKTMLITGFPAGGGQ
jgi:hypothetical protein